eukprot:209321-Chlamydomonas_euryale.AAC.1
MPKCVCKQDANSDSGSSGGASGGGAGGSGARRRRRRAPSASAADEEIALEALFNLANAAAVLQGESDSDAVRNSDGADAEDGRDEGRASSGEGAGPSRPAAGAA